MKKIKCLLFIGYVAGIASAMKFNKRTPKEIEKNEELPLGKQILEQFIHIHKNAFLWIKDQINTPENREKLLAKKEEMKEILKDFENKAKDKIEELKEKGGDWTKKAEEEIKKIYENKEEHLEKLSEWGKEKLEAGKEELEKTQKKILKKIKK